MGREDRRGKGSGRRLSLLILLAVACFFLEGCLPLGGKERKSEWGMASWYGRKWHGRKTASGERYNMRRLTAAHRTLPFDTYVRVTRLDNSRSVVVRINDRGPFKEGRIIDLSYRAAQKLGLVKKGVTKVRLDIL